MSPISAASRILMVLAMAMAQTCSVAAAEDERARLLARGEEALSASRINDAWLAFERASNMKHAVDAETAIVRTYMQAGQYRRAISFAAHTSGVHAGDPAGVGLYGWLLHLGGQRAAAERLLSEASIRLPGQRFLGEVRAAIRENAAFPEQDPPAAAVRLYPYAESNAGARKSVVAGTAVLIDQGRHAIVPTATLGGARTVWLRNGMGQTRKASVKTRIKSKGLTLLSLHAPLPLPQELQIAASDPFPGSVGYVAEYAANTRPTPAWPVLHVGFLGLPLENSADRALGVDVPRGPRGGALFDSTGRLAGIAVKGNDGSDQAVLINDLRKHLTKWFPAAHSPLETSKPSADQVYETALQTTLQVLRE